MINLLESGPEINIPTDLCMCQNVRGTARVDASAKANANFIAISIFQTCTAVIFMAPPLRNAIFVCTHGQFKRRTRHKIFGRI